MHTELCLIILVTNYFLPQKSFGHQFSIIYSEKVTPSSLIKPLVGGAQIVRLTGWGGVGIKEPEGEGHFEPQPYHGLLPPEGGGGWVTFPKKKPVSHSEK